MQVFFTLNSEKLISHYHKKWKRLLPNFKFRGPNILLFQPFKGCIFDGSAGRLFNCERMKTVFSQIQYCAFFWETKKFILRNCVNMRLLNDIFYDYKRNLTCAKFLIVKFWSSSLAAGLWSSQKLGRRRLATFTTLPRNKYFKTRQLQTN